MIAEEIEIDIIKVERSKLSQTDFDNIKFGREFSDHMMVMDFIEGKWQKPVILPFNNFSLNPATSVIHYGQSIFEGMKAYKTAGGDVTVFRPDQNIKRFNLSAERLCMPTVPEDVFMQGLTQLLSLDRDWVPTKEGSSLYIRPFMFATDEYIGVKPSESYRFCIFTCPVNKYYAGSVKVKIESHFTRATPGGTGFAKSSGNYAAALYPAKLAQEKGYDQLLWTDAMEHKYIEESGTMNIIFRSGNTIFSPATSDTILSGITRKSVLQIAKDLGYKVEERQIAVSEIYDLAKAGKLDEAFGAGTAATIAPISLIGFENEDIALPNYEEWEFAPKALATLEGIKRGQIEDEHKWNVII